MALGAAQFFDNNGNELVNGVLYSYQAGTSIQQATYTDYTGLVPNPNPITFSTGGRVNIWLSATNKYKFVLCVQNDGAYCAPADVLFSVDQVPACPGCSSGGGSTGIFTGTFISGTANTATAGILELASTDAICWRNQAGTANLCITKDTSDILDWTGGTIKLPVINCVAGVSGYVYLCPNSSTNRFSVSNNGGVYGVVPTVPNAGTSGHLASFTSNGYDLQDSGGTAPATVAVTYSATPTFTATSEDQLFTMTLTGNVTSSTLGTTGLPVPSLVSFELTQDGTGGRTFVWPSNVLGAPVPNPAPTIVTLAHFIWDGTYARLVGPQPCSTQTKTGAYALVSTDCVIQASVSAGSYTIQVPHLVTGVVWTITRTDTSTNTLTIQPDSGNVNGQGAFAMARNTTAQCHSDGANVWCAISIFAGGQLIQYGTDASCTGNGCTAETFPIPYQGAIPTCYCTGINGSCNLQTSGATKTTCAYNAAASGGINWLAIGVP